MGDDNKKNRGGRVLRFAVSGALLVAPATLGCGGEETHTNEPAPTRTNEPAPELNEPVAEPTVNEPPDAPEPDDVHVNETDPGLDGE